MQNKLTRLHPTQGTREKEITPMLSQAWIMVLLELVQICKLMS